MELDDFKSSWKNSSKENNYKIEDIFSLLKKKSSNIVKSIFIFSVIDFVLIISFFIYSFVLGNRTFDAETMKYVDPKTVEHFEMSSLFGIVLTLIFMILSYLSYKKIRFDQSTKTLISSIVKFRRIINLFILFTVLILIFSSTPLYYELGKGIYLSKHLNEQSALESSEVYGYVAVGISIFFILLLAAIYYAILYFAFLKKLQKNLRELKEVN